MSSSAQGQPRSKFYSIMNNNVHICKDVPTVFSSDFGQGAGGMTYMSVATGLEYFPAMTSDEICGTPPICNERCMKWAYCETLSIGPCMPQSVTFMCAQAPMCLCGLHTALHCCQCDKTHFSDMCFRVNTCYTFTFTFPTVPIFSTDSLLA